MKRTMIVLLATSAVVAATTLASAETLAKYECSYGSTTQDAVGDKPGHSINSAPFSCFGVDGVFKGAVYTAVAITEWDGPSGKWLLAGGVHRLAGGLAVSQALEGAGAILMKDGKPAGGEASGKLAFPFASGAVASLSGKTLKWVSRATGLNRFSLEFMD